VIRSLHGNLRTLAGFSEMSCGLDIMAKIAASLDGDEFSGARE
jgi:hypothetical protein